MKRWRFWVYNFGVIDKYFIWKCLCFYWSDPAHVVLSDPNERVKLGSIEKKIDDVQEGNVNQTGFHLPRMSCTRLSCKVYWETS
jgi:hypothetical protein